VTLSDSFVFSTVSSAVINLVVEAIGRRLSAARSKTTSPVLASIRIAAGALSGGGPEAARAAPGPSSAATSSTTSTGIGRRAR
jgi:hypothetical protein